MASPQLSIVYVWDADYPWDVRTEKICRALTEAGHRVTIVARNKAWAAEEEELPEGIVYRMRPWRWAGRSLDNVLGFPAFFSPRWARLIGRAVHASKADLLIVRDLPLCPTAIAIGRRESIPVVLDMAENYPAMMRDRAKGARSAAIDAIVRNPRITQLVERYCVTHVDWIFTVIEESSARLADIGADAKRMSVVSNTPPIARANFVDQTPLSDGHRVTLIYLGVLEAARGIGEVIDAMRILEDEQPGKFRAVIVGAGRDAKAFQTRAAKSGLSDSAVTFLGQLPHKEALQAVATANIGLIPHHSTASWNTTIPNKLFDYMSAGLPVVSSDTQPCVRIIRNNQCGEIFHSGDARSLAAAIRRVGTPADMRGLGSAGRRAVQKQYNWEHDTATLVSSISQIATESHRN